MHLCTVALYEFVYKFPCSLSASPIPGGRGCRGSRNSGGPKELSIFCAGFSILNHDIFPPVLFRCENRRSLRRQPSRTTPTGSSSEEKKKNRTRKPPKNIETHTHTPVPHIHEKTIILEEGGVIFLLILIVPPKKGRNIGRETLLPPRYL